MMLATSDEPSPRSPFGYWSTAVFLTLAVVGFVFWRAWVCDDAFITFRHVANCLAGHGPVFNVGERVQGYSHPLWFLLLLVGGRFLDVYAVAIALSLLCTAAMMLLAARFIRSGPHASLRLQAFAAILLSSRTFVEFQTSGLENPLTNLLLVALFGSLLAAGEKGGGVPARRAAWLCSLLMLLRPDHVVLCLPVIGSLLLARSALSRTRRLVELAVAAIPLAAWYGFATIYYGSPLPNTAYAKAGQSFANAVTKGMWYLWDYTLHEPLHAIAIGGAVMAVLLGALRARRWGDLAANPLAVVTIALGVQLAYVVVIGGDFMRGRLVQPILVGAALLVAYLLGWVLPRGDLDRPLTIRLAFVLLAMCIVNLDLQGLSAGVLMLGRTAAEHRWLQVGAAIAAVFLIGWALWPLARRAGRSSHWQAYPALAGLVAVEAIIVGSVIVFMAPSWPIVAMFTAGLVVSSALFAFHVAGRAVRSPLIVNLVVVLIGAVGSLCDLRSRHALPGPSGVADEYAMYAGRWNESRFGESLPHDADDVQEWVDLARTAARYADAFGPLALSHIAMGHLGYHAGPKVHVIDEYGLTDAFVGRCPAPPDARRAGHVEHEIPREYLEMRGDITLLPDWLSRMGDLDPTLAHEARAMAAAVRWPDQDLRRKWEQVRLVISGDVFSPARLKLLPCYTLGAPE